MEATTLKLFFVLLNEIRFFLFKTVAIISKISLIFVGVPEPIFITPVDGF